MPLMITAGASFHWVKRLSAEHRTKGALKIIVHGDDDGSEEQFNTAEILIFIDDAALCDRLAEAINGVAPVAEKPDEEFSDVNQL